MSDKAKLEPLYYFGGASTDERCCGPAQIIGVAARARVDYNNNYYGTTVYDRYYLVRYPSGYDSEIDMRHVQPDQLMTWGQIEARKVALAREVEALSKLKS